MAMGASPDAARRTAEKIVTTLDEVPITKERPVPTDLDQYIPHSGR